MNCTNNTTTQWKFDGGSFAWGLAAGAVLGMALTIFFTDKDKSMLP